MCCTVWPRAVVELDRDDLTAMLDAGSPATPFHGAFPQLFRLTPAALRGIAKAAHVAELRKIAQRWH
jgi:hypothetical protein